MTPDERMRCFKQITNNLDEARAFTRILGDRHAENAIEALTSAVRGLLLLAFDDEKGNTTPCPL